jgi:hypothetical protein
MVKELKEATIDIIDDFEMVLLKDSFNGEVLIPFNQFEELIEFYNKNKGE